MTLIRHHQPNTFFSFHGSQRKIIEKEKERKNEDKCIDTDNDIAVLETLLENAFCSFYHYIWETRDYQYISIKLEIMVSWRRCSNQKDTARLEVKMKVEPWAWSHTHFLRSFPVLLSKHNSYLPSTYNCMI